MNSRSQLWAVAGISATSSILTVCLVGAVAWFVFRDLPTPLPPGPSPLPEPSDKQPLVLAKEIDAPPGRMTKLPAKSLGRITWVVPPGVATLQSVEYEDHLVLCPLAEGVYDVGAFCLWEPKGKPLEVSSVVWVKVRSGKGPQPPPPGPGPIPIPPVPPKPPENDFERSVQAAYAADSGKDKLPQLKTVVAEMVTASADQSLFEVKDLIDRMTKRRTELVGDALPITRGAIGDELAAKLPKTGFLNPQNRKTCEDTFRRVGTALEKLR